MNIFSLRKGFSRILLAGIVLTTLSAHASITRFIPGFVASQPIAIPNIHLINTNIVVTKITGKLGGSWISTDSPNFTAIKLANNSFLAQITTSAHKKGVFFKIEGDHIKATEARYCVLSNCQNRNVALTDTHVTIARSHRIGAYGILDLTLSITYVRSDDHFIPGFIATQPVAIPNAYLLNANNVVTKITGRFGGNWAGEHSPDFTAIKLADNLFLAQITTSGHKKGVFFKIEGDHIMATDARYCALSDCQNRNVALTDTHVIVASSQTVGAYGIFDLVLSTTRFNPGSHFVPGFLTTQSVTIPNAHLLNANNLITKITGRFGGSKIVDINSPNFSAIELGNNSFLAQITTSEHKKGVFFKIEGDQIRATEARYCPLVDCQNRNVALTDIHVTVASSQTVGDYGIFDLILSTTRFNPNEHFIPGFVTTQPVAIPNAHLLNANNVVTKITGKFSGNLMEANSHNFTAIKLGNNSFLAQTTTDIRKKGVFFKIEGGQIKATASRYCFLTNCPNRNVALTDTHATVASSQTVGDYGIFDLILSTSYFVPDFITTQLVTIPNLNLLNTNNTITQITGKLGGASIGTPIDFTAIKLGNHSFLAQTTTNKYKKGVFFEMEGNRIKVTQARYCPLTECQERNLSLTDHRVAVTSSQTVSGYGIFDLILSTTYANQNYDTRLVRGFVTTQPITIPNPNSINVNRKIMQITGRLGGGSIGANSYSFTAIELGDNSFLAQIDIGQYKKGVFFKINNNSKIVATSARYCSTCRERNLTTADSSIVIAGSQPADGYGIFDLELSTNHVGPNSHFIPGFITTQPVSIPQFYLIDTSNVITRITGKLGGISIGAPVDFTAIGLGNNSFLAETISDGYKKGIFFEIYDNTKIMVTAARRCVLTVCQKRNLSLTDAPITIADSQAVDGYGIFDLTLSTTHIAPNEYLVSGFITTQPTAIPNNPSINASNIVTQITGKFSSSSIDNFTAIDLGENSFLAQIITDTHKKGVFFKIDNGNIMVTEARYCPLIKCQNRNLALTDPSLSISTSRASNGYGIFDLAILTTHINANEHFVSGFVSIRSVAIPKGYLISKTNIVTHVTGMLSGSSIGIPVDFTAIKLDYNLFLAQTVTDKYKKGVFFMISDNRVMTIAARYCFLANCRNRIVTLADYQMNIASSKTTSGYGISDLILSTTRINANEHFFPSFASSQPIAIPNSHLINKNNMVTHITGKFSGATASAPVDFTAIKLDYNSFLAQIVTDKYKKGVFFAINNNSDLVITAARYCLLTECQNRNVALTDHQVHIANNKNAYGYGIFDLILLTEHATVNTKNRFIPSFVGEQPVVIPNININYIVSKVTGKLGGNSIGGPDEFINFTAIKLGENSFLAQTITGAHKKGVFFETRSNGTIVTTAARYCSLTECSNRNVALTDSHQVIAGSQKSDGYGIFDLILSIVPAVVSPTTHSIPGFVTSNPTAIEKISYITGKLGGRAIGNPVNFTAIKLSENSFLAQTTTSGHKKGVFFEIEDNKVKVTQSRYCPLSRCRNRNVALTDNFQFVATTNDSDGYGIFDLVLTHSDSRISSIPGFVTTQLIAHSPISELTQITGKLGGGSMGINSYDFTAIKLGNNSFLAQITTSRHKKGVFFTIDSNGKIRVTGAHYCELTDCRNRNVATSDNYTNIATNRTVIGYGIFDLKIASLTNLAFRKAVEQSSTLDNYVASKAVDGNTDGISNNKSVSHTKKQKGAWWQVNLDGIKLIKSIRIFGRTDCCKDRLSNYRVSISNNAGFATTTYQQDFHVFPNPKQMINLSLPSVQGGYVRIQLLDDNYLSLAEVQIMGSDMIPAKK